RVTRSAICLPSIITGRSRVPALDLPHLVGVQNTAFQRDLVRVPTGLGIAAQEAAEVQLQLVGATAREHGSRELRFDLASPGREAERGEPTPRDRGISEGVMGV